MKITIPLLVIIQRLRTAHLQIDDCNSKRIRRSLRVETAIGFVNG